MEYVRWQAAGVNRHGAHAGIFGLANGLARAGLLSPEDHRWWRAANDWYDAAYPDPSSVDPTLFDKTRHPVTSCWFATTATHLIDRIPGYLDLLDRYGVPWRVRRSTDPAEVLYRDDVQVVVRPASVIGSRCPGPRIS